MVDGLFMSSTIIEKQYFCVNLHDLKIIREKAKKS